jgi:transcriptional regulator with XRE-family HTH domain
MSNKKNSFMELGKKLKELRKAYNLTQEEIANKLEISRVNYTRYENDKVRPDYETIIKIADFYDISLDELFYRKKIYL